MAETGHAKNVENWQKMIAACTGFGVDYAPSNVNLTIVSMNALLTGVETLMDGVQTSIVPWKNKVADRENIYTGVRPRTTQMLAAFKACGAAANKVDNMKTYQRQVHGARATAKPVDDPNTPGDESKGNSVSHQSYVQIAEAFGQMVALAAGEPLYTPNETHLTVATNTAYHAAMETANDDVINTVPAWKNSMTSRNARLYNDPDSIFERQKLVKEYVKSLYGAISPQYAQVKGLEFKKVK
ncbi:MAG: hypothetical protein ABL999_01600 [Pyrinomonadaceae bacterium]